MAGSEPEKRRVFVADQRPGPVDVADAGVRKVWVYQAVDDGNEVMTLLEIDNAASAQRWIDHPDTAAEWMTAVGAGGYPGLFVGKFAAAIDLMAPAGDGR
jgi:hypothetical protein